MSRRVFVGALALCQLLVVGCGGAGTQPIPQEPIAVSISPISASLLVSATAHFSAIVTGTPQTKVLFTVLEGNSGGVVAADGTYVASSIAGTYHVRVSSDADPKVHYNRRFLDLSRDTGLVDFVWWGCFRAAS